MLPIRLIEETLGRFLGKARVEKELAAFASARGVPADALDGDELTIRFAETLLASTIGPASSRLVMSQLKSPRSVSARAARQLLSAASEAIHFNRTVLQQALDHARQGITVFDKDLSLVTWNKAYQDIFDLRTRP